MTTSARYHHGNLREALVEAAVDAARERGPDGVALRELARRVGVSHNAAYRHFSDREALVAEVAERGLAALSATIERRQDAVDAAGPADPVARARGRMYAIGRAYVEFALAEPGLFKVVFSAYPAMPTEEERAGSPDPFAQLSATIDDLDAVGYLAPGVRADAEIGCWAAVHGFSVLCNEGPLRELPAELRAAALERMLDSIDRSFRGPQAGS